MPFIGVDIDNLADKAGQFTGDLLHPLSRQCILIRQVYTPCRVPGRLSFNKGIYFFKTEALHITILKTSGQISSLYWYPWYIFFTIARVF